jgi:hypothetical protein
MGSVPVSTIKYPYSIPIVVRQVLEELDEANFIIDLVDALSVRVKTFKN